MKKPVAVGIGVGIVIVIMALVLITNFSGYDKSSNTSEQNQSGNVGSLPVNPANHVVQNATGKHLEVSLSESVGIQGH